MNIFNLSRTSFGDTLSFACIAKRMAKEKRDDITASAERMRRDADGLCDIKMSLLSELLKLAQKEEEMDSLVRVRPNDQDVQRLMGLVTEAIKSLNTYVDRIDEYRVAIEDCVKTIMGLLGENPDEDEIDVKGTEFVFASATVRLRGIDVEDALREYKPKLAAWKDASKLVWPGV